MKMATRRARLVLFAVAGCAAFMALLAWACGGSTSSAPSSALAQPQCDASLWGHVYDPTRLTVKTECQTVTGTIINQHASDDGDVDMELALAPQFANLLNTGNISKLSGHLNIEAICQDMVHPDIPAASPACRDVQKMALPPVGTHVRVTGSYVLDTNHGWMEIHPISVITPQ
jgi:hypothetical protein